MMILTTIQRKVRMIRLKPHMMVTSDYNIPSYDEGVEGDNSEDEMFCDNCDQTLVIQKTKAPEEGNWTNPLLFHEQMMSETTLFVTKMLRVITKVKIQV